MPQPIGGLAMHRPGLIVLAAAALAGCGTVIDFGPEPGTTGDPSHWHYQPELHGPQAAARAERGQTGAAPASATTPAPAEPAAAAPALPPPPTETAPAPGPTSETMFNDAIRRAVAAGDLDRALRLLEEAERLGSQSARPVFIDALEGRNER
jgi:hypothetical protein